MVIRDKDVTSSEHEGETWSTCPQCNKSWKEKIPIKGMIHRTVLCPDCCQKHNKQYFNR